MRAVCVSLVMSVAVGPDNFRGFKTRRGNTVQVLGYSDKSLVCTESVHISFRSDSVSCAHGSGDTYVTDVHGYMMT